MLTLLIADDEQHIREGIANGIDWRELQIDMVLQALDGEQALQIVCENKIDILLTDIRMPIIDGIELSRNVHEIYPDCVIVFMSAYSDKEYLMSAIKLGASNYIEKPVQTAKLKDVLTDAVTRYRQHEYTKLKSILMENNYKLSMPLVKNEIALLVTNKNADMSLLLDCISNEMLGIAAHASYVTVILKTMGLFGFSGDKNGRPTKAEFFAELTEVLSTAGLQCFRGTRDDEEYILHIYGITRTSPPSQDHVVALLSQWLARHNGKRVFVSVGTVVQGFTRLHISYTSARTAINKCFFRGYGSIAVYQPEIVKIEIKSKETIDQFTDAVETGKQDVAVQLFQDFASQLRRYESADVDEIKNVYCKLMTILLNDIQNYGISGISHYQNENSLRNQIHAIQTLDELDAFCRQLLGIYFDSVLNIKGQNSLSLIISYIEKNYTQKSLDINQISQNMFLSPAYLCTYFKRETGKTIKQYITDYRLSKAADFLKDLNYNISDIAGLVGYDANYFARIFKMKFGTSPSEYREGFGIGS